MNTLHGEDLEKQIEDLLTKLLKEEIEAEFRKEDYEHAMKVLDTLPPE